MSGLPPEAARRIRLLVLDVDGVLTDGGLYLGQTDAGDRIEMKRFHVQDGLAVRLLREAGVDVAIVTGRQSDAVSLRAEELEITECHQNAGVDKLPVVEELVERLALEWGEVAFLGDDLADLAVLERVGLPAAVANAVPAVRAVAHWVGNREGGDAAVREFATALIDARGRVGETADALLQARTRA
jgi:3-deoxy-D-manno-octulosonate 8-phosphate phosphatase (KDO 8-P phosphatase)